MTEFFTAAGVVSVGIIILILMICVAGMILQRLIEQEINEILFVVIFFLMMACIPAVVIYYAYWASRVAGV